MIDSPGLAQAIADVFAQSALVQTYRLRLTGTGALQWVEQVGGEEMVHDREPGTNLWQRLGVSVLSVLPIEWLL